MSTHTEGRVIGFIVVALTVLLMWQKVDGRIDWSWWWVLAPLWGSIALGVSIVFLCAMYVAITKTED
jgi:hypothetical protein